MPPTSFNIGGVDIISDDSGFRRADGQPWAFVSNPADPMAPPGNSWAEVLAAAKNGDMSGLGDLAPHAQQLIGQNDTIAATQNYDTGFNGKMMQWAPYIIAALGTAGVGGALGAGAGAAGGAEAGGMFGAIPAGGDLASEIAALTGTGTTGLEAPIAAGGGGAGVAGSVAGVGSGGMAQVIQALQQIPGGSQIAQQLIQSMTSGQGTSGATGSIPGTSGSGGGFNIASLLPLLGIGSGLNTMFGQKPAVDPAMISALWQAGQNTYNTAQDPQQALYARTRQQVGDNANLNTSKYGLGSSGAGAGVANKADSDFNIDWQNQQLARSVQGTQAFSQAGNTAANAGVAGAAQTFAQNQTGMNNLTTGLGQLFNPGTGTGAANPIGQWLTQLFSKQAANDGTVAANDSYPTTFGSNYDGLQTDAGYYGGGV